MTHSLPKLLVANRGEIAVRIIKAAKALGIPTVAICSDVDTETMAVQLADEFCVIGKARADQSYLNGEAILNAAKETNATMIHPGYGFLAENADFAKAVEAAGLIFVGPDAQTIRNMGNKAEARRLAKQANVPIVPGYEGTIDSIDEALSIAEKIGYPLLIKAAAGGGGRGIRLATTAQELAKELPIAQGEAQAAFGDKTIYLERFIKRARHIEVQIVSDGERAIHLYERECSLQRRRQKVFEEAPSPVLTNDLREKLCTSAVRLAETIHYKGAGTLEYLYDEAIGEFFFIEMNTRIQVEHPVSELITGVDIVQEMLKIACGEKLSLHQEQIELQGTAIEMRINAEDPSRNFFPSPGIINELKWPQLAGVRIDTFVYQGYKVVAYYDSLIAKIIVYAPTREQALVKAQEALEGTTLIGINTTIPLHQWLLSLDEVRKAEFDTGTLELLLTDSIKLELIKGAI